MFKEEYECPGCVVARVDPALREGDVSLIVNRCKLHRDSDDSSETGGVTDE